MAKVTYSMISFVGYPERTIAKENRSGLLERDGGSHTNGSMTIILDGATILHHIHNGDK
jgi:hypothetical protein